MWNLSHISFFSVFYALEEESTVYNHKCCDSNRPFVHHGSVGVLAAARIRRESFTWNHGSLVALCVSVGCG